MYDYQPRERPDERTLQRTVQDGFENDPSPYDSHPSPKDRFRWVAALEARGEGDDAVSRADAWRLFVDREAIERRMTGEIRRLFNVRHGISLKG